MIIVVEGAGEGVEAVEALFGADPDAAIGGGAEGADAGAACRGRVIGEVPGGGIEAIEASAVGGEIELAIAVFGDGGKIVTAEAVFCLPPVGKGVVAGVIGVETAVGGEPDAPDVVFEDGLDRGIAERVGVGGIGLELADGSTLWVDEE